MRIHFDEAHRLFHLRTSEMSYAFGIAADGRLRHLYWGPSLSSDDSLLPLAETMLAAYEPSKGVDARKDGVSELPTMEPSDYGDPVLWVRHPDGTRGLRLLYDSHLIDGDHLTVVARDAAYAVTGRSCVKHAFLSLPVAIRMKTCYAVSERGARLCFPIFSKLYEWKKGFYKRNLPSN